MKKPLICSFLILAAIIALGVMFGGIKSSNDAEFTPVSVTVMTVPGYEATLLAVIYDQMDIASTEVEITTKAELTELIESITDANSELNLIVMISPILRTQSRKYERLENQLHPAVRGSSVIALGDGVRFVNIIGLTNLRQ